jgi:S1-C subfamily serine protease
MTCADQLPFIESNATINTGNSGGPMFNAAGEVIGIVSHNISKSGGCEGLGFVVTIDGEQMVLGGDIILSVEGLPADSAANMMKVRYHLATLKPGEPLTATVLRKGRVVDLQGIVP